MSSKRFFVMAVFFIILATPFSAFAGFLKGEENGPTLNVSPPKVRVEVLENGIRCFLLEDHTLPLVQMGAITKTGGIYEPAEKTGLAELTGMLMRSGGAGALSAEGFDKSVDDLGGALESSIASEMGVANLAILSEDLEAGMALFFDMLFEPRFDEGRLKTAVAKIEEVLRREADDPDSLAMKRFLQLVYGKESPWARRPTHQTLSGLTTSDVRSFHHSYFRTGNILLYAAGDFDAGDFLKLVNRLTKGAPEGKVDLPSVDPVSLKFEPATDEVTRPMTQSFIRMGHLGIKRHNQDKFAVTIMNEILGGGSFKSRLMGDIRTRRGMAYSIWSKFSPATDYGIFYVGVDTKSSQAARVILLIKDHLSRMAGGADVSEEELKFARLSLLSSLVFEFDRASKIVERRATFFFYGYPDNYWDVYRDRISKVTAGDVKEVAGRYLHPEGLKTVIVGPKTKN